MSRSTKMEVSVENHNTLASWLESKLNNFFHAVATKYLPKYRYFQQDIDFVRHWADHGDIPLNDTDFCKWMASMARIIRKNCELYKSSTSLRRPISGRKIYKSTKYDVSGSLLFLLDSDVLRLSRYQLRVLFREVMKTLIIKYTNEIDICKAVSPGKKSN